MAILSTDTRLVRVGQDYSAGSGISIDDHVISVTGEFGKTYSAGENIDIYEQDEQLYISSKDWSDDIANASANAYEAATAQIPDPFDPTYLSAQIDNKLNSSDFTTWQNGQYSTDLQTIEGQITNKLDESAFSTVSGDFLTAAPADMATTGDVAELAQTISETYQVKGDYLTTADSANFYPMTGNPSSFATENWVTEQGYITGVDLSEYAKRDFVLSSIESATSGKLDVSSFASVSGDFLTTSFEIPESAAWSESTYITQTNSSVWNNVTGKQDSLSFHYLEI